MRMSRAKSVRIRSYFKVENFRVEVAGGRYEVGLVLEMNSSNHLGRSHRLDDLVTFMGVVA